MVVLEGSTGVIKSMLAAEGGKRMGTFDIEIRPGSRAASA